MEKRKIEDINLEKVSFPLMQKSDRISFSSREIKGLNFHFKRNGRKEWHFRYTSPTDGRRTTFKLGNYPNMGYQEAKEKVFYLQSTLNKGIDPVEHKHLERINKVRIEQSIAIRNNNQFDFLTCATKFLAHSEKKNLSASTLKRYRSVVNKYIIPEMGAWDVRIFDFNGFVELLNRVMQDYASTADHLFKTTRAILSYLVEEGVIQANPLYGRKDLLKKINVSPRTRSLSSYELYKFLNELDSRPYTEEVRFTLYLMILTGLRVGEVASLRYSNILFKEMRIHHPKEEMKARKEAYTAMTEKIFKALALWKRQTEGGYDDRVFPQSFNKDTVINALKQKKHKDWIDFSSHDLRRTVRTQLQSMGCPQEVRMMITNHTGASGVAAHYDLSQMLKQQREWLERWHKQLDEVKLNPTALLDESDLADDSLLNEFADIL